MFESKMFERFADAIEAGQFNRVIRYVTSFVLELLPKRSETGRRRDFPLGFESKGVVDLGDETELEATLFAGAELCSGRLLVPSDIAGAFELTDILVNGKSQLHGGSVGMSCRAFQENAIGIYMSLEQPLDDHPIVLKVKNVGSWPQTFRAVLVCQLDEHL
jgi:hypothetical protein